MQLAIGRAAITVGIIFYQSPPVRAETPTSINNDTYNTVLCGGFNEIFAQVDVSCPSWIGSIDASNQAGHLINRHHNITCTNLSAAIPTLSRGLSLKIKGYIDVINQNERIAAAAFKHCNATIAAKAQFNELSAFDEMDKIIANNPKDGDGNAVNADNRDSMIESSPYSEKVKAIASAANVLSDPETGKNIQSWLSDLSNDPAYTLVYTASQAAASPLYRVMDAKDFANKITPGYSGPTSQEVQVNQLSNAVPKVITNYITTVFE